jgi:hypothetical protein
MYSGNSTWLRKSDGGRSPRSDQATQASPTITSNSRLTIVWRDQTMRRAAVRVSWSAARKVVIRYPCREACIR